MHRRHPWRFALGAGISLVGLACAPNDANLAASNDAWGPGIIVSPDGGFRIPDFACDGSASEHETTEPPDAPRETGGCIVQNRNVRFQTDVLPVFGGCSGELCHAPWTYRTTVGITSTECCDQRRIVDPGNPGGSYLLQKIRGIDLCGNSGKMGDVSPAVANAIADWICLGALDN